MFVIENESTDKTHAFVCLCVLHTYILTYSITQMYEISPEDDLTSDIRRILFADYQYILRCYRSLLNVVLLGLTGVPLLCYPHE